LWQTLEHWMGHLLDQISLADLLQNERGIPELLRTRLTEALAEAPGALIPLTLVDKT